MEWYATDLIGINCILIMPWLCTVIVSEDRHLEKSGWQVSLIRKGMATRFFRNKEYPHIQRMKQVWKELYLCTVCDECSSVVCWECGQVFGDQADCKSLEKDGIYSIVFDRMYKQQHRYVCDESCSVMNEQGNTVCKSCTMKKNIHRH
jgi:hypothetical protein